MEKLVYNDEKSRRPNNGQKALDTSVPVENKLTQRVSVDGEEIVILNYTAPGKYHAYTTTWKELEAEGQLSEDIRNTLINNGFFERV